VSLLTPGTGVDAATLALTHEPLPAAEVVDGAPTTAMQTLAHVGGGVGGGVEVGVWEMTPGTATDVEADEVFIVLSGHATIAFDDPALPELAVGPGSVVRLGAGQKTVWTVSETLRKIFVV
jgi:uncharacterized cupin superfamily protein